ncbi:MAG: 23S rRNA (uridine(2479)-2'-O)-methyltransferase [Chlamydiae bacterium]|nr:23S rRNA (uridine(2479)-2'-O)-methyltransferase [Chlamydiota bacterium]
MDRLISSTKNPKVKQARKLWQRRQRDEQNLFLIEGYRELLRASEGGQPLEMLFVAPELFLGANETKLIEKLTRRGTELLQCSERVFRSLSYRDRPDGLLAIAPKQSRSLEDLKPSETPLFVVAEAIEKPGNLGTIMRSADAVGVDGVIVCDRCTDITNPNVVRASVGTLFTLPVVETTTDETLHWLKERGVKIVASTPSAQALYTEVDLSGPVAVVVGTEQYGLSERWLEEADLLVRIPMNGHADSLNVAMATTLLLYEALRQKTKECVR